MPTYFDQLASVQELFGITCDVNVPRFNEKTEHVPDIKADYHFDKETTLAILAGFTHNRRVLIQGFHGTGKTSHIEQIAARLNWPCIRLNLDSHISRIDLIGKDVITLKENRQITAFQEGILPWALQRPCALIFDEYDAGRPDVMFVINRILESEGKLTLLDQSRVIQPHPAFRIFATANTIGLGDTLGIYHGTQQLNQGQLDRWNIISTLNYLKPEHEVKIVQAHVPELNNENGTSLLKQMVKLAELTRTGFANQDLSTVLSPRSVINWAINIGIFSDVALAFKMSFMNRCDDDDKPMLVEYYQRCFDEELEVV